MQRVGMVGGGHIADVYLRNAARFADISVVACASRRLEVARALAAQHGIEVRSVDSLLAADDIDIVLNLTPPQAHADVTLAALRNGKHVYSEKPLAITLQDGERILGAASASGLRVGCAPDTAVGAGVQTARAMVDDGRIGRPLLGNAAMLSRGMESWHPNPEMFFRKGGGPVLDLGPYYLAALFTLLGPVAEVRAIAQVGLAERIVTAENSPYRGRRMVSETPTTVLALLHFVSGAQVSFVASWDAWKTDQPFIEIHGTDASLRLPHYNWFGGEIGLASGEQDWQLHSTADMTFGRNNWQAKAGPVANYRGLGLAEMARAIESGRPHRQSAEMSLHLLEVMLAILASAETGGARKIGYRCERSAPLDEVEAASLLVAGDF